MRKAIGRFLSSAVVLVTLSTSVIAHAADGLVTRSSKYPVAEAMDKLESAIRQGGAMIFARINLKAVAQKSELLRPHEIIFFGRGGAIQPFLSASSQSAIDFPQKIIVFEDQNGRSWVSYNKAEYVAGRHGIANAPGVAQSVAGIDRTVSGFADLIAE